MPQNVQEPPTDVPPNRMVGYTQDSSFRAANVNPEPVLITPSASSDKVDGLNAVTAKVGGPNVLVATDGTGKLPTSIIPLAATIGITKYFQSAATTITASTNITVAHGLGTIPLINMPVLRCISTELGYSVNDEIPLASTGTQVDNGTDNFPCAYSGAYADATNCGFAFSPFVKVTDRSAHAIAGINFTKWNIVFRAWA